MLNIQDRAHAIPKLFPYSLSHTACVEGLQGFEDLSYCQQIFLLIKLNIFIVICTTLYYLYVCTLFLALKNELFSSTEKTIKNTSQLL